jgi:catechol 2,3-dioxygenase-like lactoylglutathione lyase family enzyme
MEAGPALPGRRDRYHDLDPAVVYVSLSVLDIDEAVTFFADVVGFCEVDVRLHTAEDEALWGLSDAPRRTAVLLGGATFLELIEYGRAVGAASPEKEPLRAQGFKTVAVGYRDPDDTRGLFERVKAAGLRWTVEQPESFIGGNHVAGAVAHHMKTLSVLLELEQQFGYRPEPPRWWRPPAAGEAEVRHAAKADRRLPVQFSAPS